MRNTMLRTLLGFMAMAAVANANTGPPPDTVATHQALLPADVDAAAQPPDKPSSYKEAAAYGTCDSVDGTAAHNNAADPISGMALFDQYPTSGSTATESNDDGICYTGAARASPPTLSSETAVLMHDPDEEGNGWASKHVPAAPPNAATLALALLGRAPNCYQATRRNC